jgi:hypothetical protein
MCNKRSVKYRNLIIAAMASLALNACPNPADNVTSGLPVLQGIYTPGPAQTVYDVDRNESLSLAGLWVSAYYSDESWHYLGEDEYTLEWEGGGLSGITASTGEKTVSVRYQGQAASFTVYVITRNDFEGTWVKDAGNKISIYAGSVVEYMNDYQSYTAVIEEWSTIRNTNQDTQEEYPAGFGIVFQIPYYWGSVVTVTLPLCMNRNKDILVNTKDTAYIYIKQHTIDAISCYSSEEKKRLTL